MVRRILLIGPLPPPFGGATVSFATLVGAMRASGVSYEVFDTVKARFPVLMLLAVVRTNAQVVVLNASTPAFVYAAFAISVVCRARKLALVLRPFGGAFAEQYRSKGFVFRLLVRSLFMHHRILLQTKAICRFFCGEFSDARIDWFPTSRLPRGPVERNEFSKRETIRFVYLGQVQRDKGIDVIKEAVRRSGGSFDVTICGPLRNGITQTELEEAGLRYFGVIAPDKVCDFLANFDVLIFPTFYRGEGYPGVILEAFFAGLPVITTRWKDIPELVNDGENGVLIPIRDSMALFRAMERLSNDADFRRSLAKGSRISAASFSSDRWNRDFVMKVCREELALASDDSKSG